MRCVSIPPTQSEVITRKIVTRLSRIKTSAQHLFRDMFKHRVGIASPTRPNYHSTKSAIAITVGIILLVGIGMLSYSNNSESDLSHPEGKWKTTAQISQDSNPEPKLISEVSKRHFVDPSSTFSNHKPAEAGGRKHSSDTPPAVSENFEVVDYSFVRDQPESDANIIATLRPGTQIRVESKTGDYLRVRSLSDADVIGYVHEEDAFFQAR